MHVCNPLWPKDKLAAGRAMPREAVMQLKCCSCALPCFVWNHIVQNSAFLHSSLSPGQAFIGEECEDDKTRFTTNTIVPKPEKAKGGEGKKKGKKKTGKTHQCNSPFNQTKSPGMRPLPLSVGRGLVVCQDYLGVGMVVNF